MWLLTVLLAATAYAQTADAKLDAQARALRSLMESSPRLALAKINHPVEAPAAGWALDMVSSVASDADGTRYLFQRGDKADPIIAIDAQGRVLRSWGKGLFQIPHSIRVDPAGHVWVVDAASSMVYQFTREGRKLLEIAVGGQPKNPRSPFCGTTDIAFAPGGRLFISDGYANARILEYDAKGKRLREWGTAGTGPGQFHLPHGIAADKDGILYVADRENGRIQRFDLNGKHLGTWDHLGKTFSITISRAGELYIGTQPRNQPNGAQGWLVHVDKKTGKVLGQVESNGHHSVDVLDGGELLTGMRPDVVLWFRRR
jgi:DNA-binding beta-propeller fold protein YncE